MVDKRNIFLIGPIGSGKSTIGRKLAQQLKMEFFDSDQEIEKRSGADISWIFDIEGEDGFRSREKKIIKELTEKKGIVLAAGCGSIQNIEIRNRLSSKGIVVYLETTIENQILRMRKDKKKLQLNYVKFSHSSYLEEIANKINPLYEKIADIKICTYEFSIKVIINKIINMIKNH